MLLIGTIRARRKEGMRTLSPRLSAFGERTKQVRNTAAHATLLICA
jgi:hypothetical protein